MPGIHLATNEVRLIAIDIKGFNVFLIVLAAFHFSSQYAFKLEYNALMISDSFQLKKLQIEIQRSVCKFSNFSLTYNFTL